MRRIEVLKKAVLPLMVGGMMTFGPSSGEAQQASTPPTQEPAQGLLVSWTSDRHALREGDIITILVDEHLLASAQKDESASQMRDRDLGLTARTPGSTSGVGLRTQNDVADRNRGEASRTQRFSGEISARVLEVSPSGLARLEGSKKVQIDKVEEELIVRGWVRPQDLSLSNTVESWRLSDTEILLTSNGSLGQTGGFWSKLLNWIWP
jgi:flagellar L-ring protein precursor FlgH